MAVPPHVIPAIATITAAFLAGGVTFLVSVLSKEQKTSEFRQQWIDALRNDIADLIGEAALLHEVAERIDGKGMEAVDKAIETRYANMLKVRTLVARIELRINPGEHTEFVKALRDFQSNELTKERSSRDRVIAAMTEASQRVLKKEWKRVKSGERAFVVTKYFAGAIAVAALIVGIVAVYQNLPTSAAPPTTPKLAPH